MTNIPEDLTAELAYNSHDLGEFGRVIRLTYLYPILERYSITKPRNEWDGVPGSEEDLIRRKRGLS